MAALTGPRDGDGDARSPFLVVGLGNPGPRYRGTRHNVGFMVVDRLVGRLSATLAAVPDRDLILYRAGEGDRVVCLVQPLTYMNASGTVVSRMAHRLGLPPERVLVVVDCLDLPLGRIRLRPRGSSGGHRGVDSVIRELGTDQFPRLRVGIGRPESGEAIEHVLSPWAAAERSVLATTLEAAADAVCLALAAGVEAAMNRYNGWSAAEDNAATTQGEVNIEDV
ncbi:MAG: aminoacyl-tRNA hydrolase [Lentisphaeria bacterium]|nr:aminoacyl-tRNA hydrolase [Lentisphaeria bacterium]